MFWTDPLLCYLSAELNIKAAPLWCDNNEAVLLCYDIGTEQPRKIREQNTYDSHKSRIADISRKVTVMISSQLAMATVTAVWRTVSTACFGSRRGL